MTTMLKGPFFVDKQYDYDPVNMEAAKKILWRSIQLDNKNWLTKANMAVLETTVKNYAEAGKLYAEALKLSDNHPELSFQVADYYHRQKEFGKAKEHYQLALKGFQAGRVPASEKRMSEVKSRLTSVDQKKPLE